MAAAPMIYVRAAVPYIGVYIGGIGPSSPILYLVMWFPRTNM